MKFMYEIGGIDLSYAFAEIKKVNCDGLEPTTSALSRQRSEPTELTIPKDSQRYNKVFE